MVFYFSATGNSEWAAKEIAAALNDRAVNMLHVVPETLTFSENEMIGIVFPVYFYAAPDYVLDFCKKLNTGSNFTYAVCTYCNVTGHAMQHLSAEALHLHCGYGLLMPDNTTVFGAKYDDEESAIEKLRTASERLQVLIQRIKKRETDVFDSKEGENAAENTMTSPVRFRENSGYTAPFYVEEEKCISCGICEEHCTARAIKLVDGKPEWVKEKCYYCGACLNRCPTEAIEFGDRSQGKFRYTFEKFHMRLLSHS